MTDQPDNEVNVEEIIEKEIQKVDEVTEDGKGLVLVSELLPEELPIFPLTVRPFFPGLPVPMEVSGEQLRIVEQAIESSSKTMGLVLVRDPESKSTSENLHRMGVVAKIVQVTSAEGGAAHLVVNCLERFEIQEVHSTSAGLMARVEYHPAPELSVNTELKAYAMAIVSTLKDLINLNPLQSEAIRMFLSRSTLDDPGRLADFAASLTTADNRELQKILETLDVRRRIDRTLVLLRKELDLTRLQNKITKQIEKKISSQQREFFLREELKAIKKELGLEKEGKDAEIEKFQRRLRKLRLNEEAEKEVENEMEKLQLLEAVSPEYAVTRNYLDWLTVLPWGRFSKDSYDLKRARRILDRDHYGLEDVKERILEFVAVGRMKGDITGSIICLVGPPGVGKTSIGRSIALALGRQFYRFSLGGMRDEAEIKGHRRTYVGALPGKFIQAMKTVGTSNPLIMLDEIDKVGVSFQGDPASALLEVLDPEQNKWFRDHYLDVPFDLSHVLFVTTANQLDTIPSPLLDRMEVIRLSGYILEEKVQIARRYLVPKNVTAHGLAKRQLRIYKSALVQIIENYAREAGVRNLENKIKKIARRATVKLFEDGEGPIIVLKRDVPEYLGNPVYEGDEIFETAPGIVTGLAWTSLGGATLQIEAAGIATSSKGFKQTGQLGEVMVESSEIAYSYVMAHMEEFGCEPGYFEKHSVHLHVPAGATPKDGPSAGITMATALISMIKGRPVRRGLAMTGELTLTGRILSIGGVKEKVIAARRAGCKTLIFPEENEKGFNDLPVYLKEGLEVHFSRQYKEVFQLAFGV